MLVKIINNDNNIKITTKETTTYHNKGENLTYYNKYGRHYKLE